MAGVDVYTYIDENTTVVSDVLLNYSGNEKTLVINSEIDNQSIRKIGDGAFHSNNTLEEVIIDEGIEELGDSAFKNCSELKKVTLPESFKKGKTNTFFICSSLEKVVAKRKIEKRDYEIIINNSIRREDGTYLVRNATLLKANFSDIFEVLGAVARPAGLIDENMLELHRYKINNAIDSKQESIDLFTTNKEKSETQGLKEQLEENRRPIISQRLENKISICLKGKVRHIQEQSIIISINDKEKHEEDNYVHVECTFELGVFFWQTIRSIKYGCKKYYIYERIGIAYDKCEEWPIEFPVILDENLQMVAGELQKDILAKYRLLTTIATSWNEEEPYKNVLAEQYNLMSTMYFIDGSGEAPTNSEEISSLIRSLCNLIQFSSKYSHASELKTEEKNKVEKVIKACFRFASVQDIVKALEHVRHVNDRLVKEVFYNLDDPIITGFILQYRDDLGL